MGRRGVGPTCHPCYGKLRISFTVYEGAADVKCWTCQEPEAAYNVQPQIGTDTVTLLRSKYEIRRNINEWLDD